MEEDLSHIKAKVGSLKNGALQDVRGFFDSHPDMVRELVSSVRVLDANQAALDLSGARSKSELVREFPNLLSQMEPSQITDQLVAIAENRPDYESEGMQFNLRGEPVHFMLKWTVVPGFRDAYSRVLVSVLDVTKLREANERLSKALQEKEVLLQEVHHRVKNNLSVIHSLLNLQANNLGEKTAEESLQELRSRIHSMALAHELLYKSQDLSSISACEYLMSLLKHIKSAGYNLERAVTIKTAIRQGITLGMKTCIPLGLILNELISNCAKHAFPEGKRGQINVSLNPTSNDGFELVVKDDGVGMPDDVNVQHSESLGMVLVNTFVRQLNGTLEIGCDQGTEVRVNFCSLDSSR